MKTSRMRSFVSGIFVCGAVHPGTISQAATHCLRGTMAGPSAFIGTSAAGRGPRFCAYAHHDAAGRECAYDCKDASARFDKRWDEAVANVWTMVDLKKERKVVFPFDNP